MKKALITATLILSALVAKSEAQIFSASEDSTLFGYLNQLEPQITNAFGINACVPTSSINAMTYLQNMDPLTFGTNLTGSTYTDWINADLNLGSNYFGTTSSGGTPNNVVQSGLQNYFSDLGFTNVFINTQLNTETRTFYGNLLNNFPTINFFESALSASNPIIFGFASGAIGHELLATGLSWDPISSSGTLNFIDPQYASTGNSRTGPALVSSGSIALVSTNIPFVDGSGMITSITNALYISYDSPSYGTSGGYINSAILFTVNSGSTGAIPEPSDYTLFGLGALALIIAYRRKTA